MINFLSYIELQIMPSLSEWENGHLRFKFDKNDKAIVPRPVSCGAIVPRVMPARFRVLLMGAMIMMVSV